MKSSAGKTLLALMSITALLMALNLAGAEESEKAQNPYLKGTEGYYKGPRGLTSYQPIAIDQPFAAGMAHDVAAKAGIERAHQAMLEERYDLGDHPAQGVTMEHEKPLQEGVRVKLPSGVTWEQLAAMSPDDIREKGLWPKGFLPLPHPFHPTGGFVFPKEEIDAIKQQDGRDLTRFDIDFDLPERFLAAFPPPTTASRRCPASDQPASIAMRMATRTAPLTSPPIPARSGTVTASRRCRSAALTFNDCSARSVP
jgi:cytochrome c peroxidase